MLRISSTNLASGNFLCTFCKRWRREGRGFKVMSIPGDYELRYITSCQNTVRWSMERFPQLRHSSSGYAGSRLRGFDVSATSAKSTGLEVKMIRDGSSSASKSASSILVRREWTRTGRTSSLLAAETDDIAENRTDNSDPRWTRNQIQKCKGLSAVVNRSRAAASASPNRASVIKTARPSPSEDGLARRTQKMLQRSDSMRLENLGKFEKTIRIKSDYKMWQGEPWTTSKSAGSDGIGRKMVISRESFVRPVSKKIETAEKVGSGSEIADDRAEKDFARFQEVLQVPGTVDVEQFLHVQDLRRREKSKPKTRKTSVNAFRVSDPAVRQRLQRNKINAEIYDQVRLLEQKEPHCEFAEIQCGRKKLYVALLEDPPEEAVPQDISVSSKTVESAENTGEIRKDLSERPLLGDKLAAMTPEKIALVTPEKIAKMIGAGADKSGGKQMKIVREKEFRSTSSKLSKSNREKPVKLEIPKKGGDLKVVVNLKKSGKDLMSPTVRIQQKTPEGVVGNTMKFQVKKMEKYWFATSNGKVRIQYLTGVLTNMKNRLRERMDVFRCPVTLPDQGKIVFYGKSSDSKPPEDSPRAPTQSPSPSGTPTGSSTGSSQATSKQSIARRLKLLNTKKSDPASAIKKETERKYLFRILRRKARKVANEKGEVSEDVIKAFPKLDAITNKAARGDAKEEHAAAAAQGNIDKMGKEPSKKVQRSTLEEKPEPVEDKPQGLPLQTKSMLQSPRTVEFEKKSTTPILGKESLPRLKHQPSFKETGKSAKPHSLQSKPSINPLRVDSVARDRPKMVPSIPISPTAEAKDLHVDSEPNPSTFQEEQSQQSLEALSRWRPESQWTVPQASESLWKEEISATAGNEPVEGFSQMPQRQAWPTPAQGDAQKMPVERSFERATWRQGQQQIEPVTSEETSNLSQEETGRNMQRERTAVAYRREAETREIFADQARANKWESYPVQQQVEAWQTQEPLQNQEAQQQVGSQQALQQLESQQAEQQLLNQQPQQQVESQQGPQQLLNQQPQQQQQQQLKSQQAPQQLLNQQPEQQLESQQVQPQLQKYPFDGRQQNWQFMHQQEIPHTQAFTDSRAAHETAPKARSSDPPNWSAKSDNDRLQVQQYPPNPNLPAQAEPVQQNKNEFYYPEMVSERSRLSRRPAKPGTKPGKTLQFTALDEPFVPVRVIAEKDISMCDNSDEGPVRQPFLMDTDPRTLEPEQNLAEVPRIRKLAQAVSGGTSGSTTSDISNSYLIETDGLADFVPQNSFNYNYDHELQLTSFEKVVAENFTRVSDVDLIDVKKVPTMNAAANRPEAFPGFSFDTHRTSEREAPNSPDSGALTDDRGAVEIPPLPTVRTLPSDPDKRTSVPDRKDTQKPTEEDPGKDALQVTIADGTDHVIQKLKDELSTNLRNEWKAKLFDELAEKIKPVIEFKLLPRDKAISGLDKTKSLGDLGMEEELKSIRDEIERIKQKVTPNEKDDDEGNPKHYRRLAVSPVLICDESFLRPRVKQSETDDYSYYRKSVSVPIMSTGDDVFAYGQNQVPEICVSEPLESPHLVMMSKGDEVKTSNPPTQNPPQQPPPTPQSTPAQQPPSEKQVAGQEKETKPPTPLRHVDPKYHPYLPKKEVDPAADDPKNSQHSQFSPQSPYPAHQPVQVPPTPQSPYYSHQTVEVRPETTQAQETRQGSSTTHTINPKDHPYLPIRPDNRQHQQKQQYSDYYKSQETSTHSNQQQGAQTHSQSDQYNWYRQTQTGQFPQTQDELEEQRRRYFEYYAHFHQQPQPAPTQAELEEQRRKRIGQDGKSENKHDYQKQHVDANAAATKNHQSPTEVEEQRRRYFDYYAKYHKVPPGYESTNDAKVPSDAETQRSETPEKRKGLLENREPEKTTEVRQKEADKTKSKYDKSLTIQAKAEKSDGEKVAKESKPTEEKGSYLKNLLLKTRGKDDKKSDAGKPHGKPSEIKLKDLPPAKPEMKKQAEKAGGDKLKAPGKQPVPSDREEKLRKHKEEAALQLRAQQEMAAKRDAEEKKKQEAARLENEQKRREDLRMQNFVGFLGYGLEVPQQTNPVLPIPPDKKPDESKEKQSEEKKIKLPGPDTGTADKKSKLDESEPSKPKPPPKVDVLPSKIEKSTQKKEVKADTAVKSPEKSKAPELKKVETAPKPLEKAKSAEAKTEQTPKPTEKLQEIPDKSKIQEVKKTEATKTPDKKPAEQVKTPESKKVEATARTPEKPKAPEKKPETSVKAQSAPEKSKTPEVPKPGQKASDTKPSVTNVEKKAPSITAGDQGDKTQKTAVAPKKIDKASSDKPTKVDDAKAKSDKKFWEIGRRKSESDKDKISPGDKVIGLFLKKEKKPGETDAKDGDKGKKTPEKKAKSDDKGEKKAEATDPPKVIPAPDKVKKEPGDKEKGPKMEAGKCEDCSGGGESECPTPCDGIDGKAPGNDGEYGGGGASSPPIMSVSYPSLDSEQYDTTGPQEFFSAGVGSFAFDQYLSTEDAQDILHLNKRYESTIAAEDTEPEEPEMRLHRSPSIKVVRIFVVNNRKVERKLKKAVEVEEREKVHDRGTTESMDILTKAFSYVGEEPPQVVEGEETAGGPTLYSDLLGTVTADTKNVTSTGKGSRGSVGSVEALRRAAAVDKNGSASERRAGNKRKATRGKRQEAEEGSDVASDPGDAMAVFRKVIESPESRHRKRGGGDGSEKKESDPHSFLDVLKGDVAKETRAASPAAFSANSKIEETEPNRERPWDIRKTSTSEMENSRKESPQRKRETEYINDGDLSLKIATDEPTTGKGKMEEAPSESRRTRSETAERAEGKAKSREDGRNAFATSEDNPRRKRGVFAKGKDSGTEEVAESPSKTVPEVSPQFKEDEPQAEAPIRAESQNRQRVRPVREVSPKPKRESFVPDPGVGKEYAVREEPFEIELVPTTSESTSPSRKAGTSTSRRNRDKSESVSSAIRTAKSDRDDRRGKRPRTILPDSPNADFVREERGAPGIREEAEQSTMVEPETSGGRKASLERGAVRDERKFERVKRAVREESAESEPITFLPPKPRDRKTGQGKTTKKGGSGFSQKRELRTLSEAMLKHFEVEALESGGSREPYRMTTRKVSGEMRGEERAASAESILGESLRSRIASVPHRKTQLRMSEKEMSGIRDKTELKTVHVVEEPQRRERPSEADAGMEPEESSYRINLEAISRKASAIPCAVAVDPEEQARAAVYTYTDGKSKGTKPPIPKFWWQKLDNNRK